MTYSALLSPINIGTMHLPNRVVMAPLTRLRSRDSVGVKPGLGGTATELMATYYTQRASAGMIIIEATDISPQAKGYAGAPAIYNAEQIAAWKTVTDSVHQAGGRIGIQLWHTGLVSHYSLQPGAAAPVSSSAVDLGQKSRTSLKTPEGNIYRETTTPTRALSTAEIGQIVDDFAQAARNAMTAGMDFIELHAAHGYLIHQFLYDSINQRDDQYGGSVANRLRFLREILTAVTAAIGADRVGIRISPLGQFNAVSSGDEAQALALIEMLDGFKLAYMHISEPDWAGAKPMSMQLRQQIRAHYHGVIIGSGAYTAQKADDLIRAGVIDAVAFGRAYIANPDLVERFEKNAPLNVFKPEYSYGGDKTGYTDYPTLAKS